MATKRCHASLACFSLARASSALTSLARFSITRSQFGVMAIWHELLWRVSHFCAYVDPVCNFISAMEYCLHQFGTHYFGAYLFLVRIFPFCEEVLSPPVWRILLWRVGISIFMYL